MDIIENNMKTGSAEMHERFKTLRLCVIIPTYNNATTLAQVIQDVQLYTNDIIVVNDGSTDTTASIAAAFEGVQLIGYEENVGKGWALRTAFKYAAEKGYQHAITIDSDGQHFAKDLPLFVEALEQQPDTMIIGSRNMGQDSVPGGSSFGHKFSNFWFKLETGINCPDTQSGFRLYPLYLLKNMRFFTKKYEFEIEVIVRAAWKGISFSSVPVTVYYAPKETRISHFRPYKDFTRISLLNTVLVLITFLYIKPRNFFRALSSKKKIKEQIKLQLFNPLQSDLLKAFSVGFGVFMGIIPIWGFQLMAAIFLAILFKLNKALVIIAANISIPPMIPFIIFGSYWMGGLFMGTKLTDIEFSRSLSLDFIKKNLTQYLYGSISLAIVAGLFFGLITFMVLKLMKRKQAATA